MSGASTSNCPCLGSGACHSSTGSISGKPRARSARGHGMASNKPPAKPAAPAHSGACATHKVAKGSLASHCKPVVSTDRANAARLQNSGHNMPSKAKGVATRVTHGIAKALANSPTRETCPNSNRVKGVSARVMTPCSLANAAKRALTPGGAEAPSPASVANNTPTATKLNQKPACSMAQGSNSTTTAQASSHTWGQGQRLPDRRNKPTAASMSTVRCEGTPQPLKTA